MRHDGYQWDVRLTINILHKRALIIEHEETILLRIKHESELKSMTAIERKLEQLQSEKYLNNIFTHI